MPSRRDLRENGGDSPPRLGAVEGVRAYLALWVVVCHAMWASGYEPAMLSGLPSLLRRGDLAVEVFIIISAFVIFLLLDTKRPSFGPFIVRRFFRLFPLFTALFLIAIPVSRVSLWNATHAAAYVSSQHIDQQVLRIETWWQNLHWHVPLHLLMLQGAVPEEVLQDSPGAFLDPAWSVSLEWQFYLVAPLAFALAVSARPFRRIALVLGCVFLFLAAQRLLPSVKYGAALPYHVEYFFVGAVSYFIYKWYSGRARAAKPFLLGCCLAIVFVSAGGEDRLRWVPLALWAAFLGLLLEHPSTLSWRVAGSLFTNRIAQGLGRVSYGIYLSHMLLLAILQCALLRWAPDLSRPAHFGILLALTTTGTLTASVFLYRYVEAPGISAGRALAKRLDGIYQPVRRPRTTTPDRAATTRAGLGFAARSMDNSRSA